MGSKPKKEKPIPPPPPPIPPPAPIATNDMVQEEYMKDKNEKRQGRRSTILSLFLIHISEPTRPY